MNTNTLTRISTLAAAIGLALSANVWAAGDTAVQTVGYDVQEVAQISVTEGSPGTLTISAATPGSVPDPDELLAGTYSITNNAGTDSKKITAAISTGMPSGVTLKVLLAAPDGATSEGSGSNGVALSATDADVVTGIDSVNETGLAITYQLSATIDAEAMETADSRVVTFTITDQGGV